MASLPPEVRGVGSGSLNTMRQVGFTIGVAVLVAIFTHTVAQNARQATREAVGFVAAQQQLSPAEKSMYSAAILKNAKAAASSGGAAALTTEPLKGAPHPPTGTPQALTWQKVNAGAAAIYRRDIAKSFSWPFYAAALAALLAAPAALFTGRRLGSDAGHHEMTREERAAHRTLVAEEAEAAEGSSATAD